MRDRGALAGTNVRSGFAASSQPIRAPTQLHIYLPGGESGGYPLHPVYAIRCRIGLVNVLGHDFCDGLDLLRISRFQPSEFGSQAVADHVRAQSPASLPI